MRIIWQAFILLGKNRKFRFKLDSFTKNSNINYETYIFLFIIPIQKTIKIN